MAAAATWAITLDGARDGAIVVAVVGVVAALLAVWLLEQIVSKLVTVAVAGVLVALVWSQRTSLDECADHHRRGIEHLARAIPGSEVVVVDGARHFGPNTHADAVAAVVAATVTRIG